MYGQVHGIFGLVLWDTVKPLRDDPPNDGLVDGEEFAAGFMASNLYL